ncbi:uncharacterized protein K02A2.6-like [Eupeodes corollae]|uniref:uncharacterized protein K02A2.6-like n=1 Tax=Eupeodes corollae TaxID=290404 RepID=UPI0024900F66|nr:uncharacterized protein K02A2.6-like [Eupeodes corollae]
MELKVNGKMMSFQNKALQAYGGSPLSIRGELKVDVSYKEETHKVNLLVVDSAGANILGMDWFRAFNLTIQHSVLSINSSDSFLNSIQALCKAHADLFSTGLGRCKEYKAHLALKEGAVPKFVRHRPIPYALVEDTQNEVDRLVAAQILKQAHRTQWAAPVVIVQKANGGIRICGDFKSSVNPQLIAERHPIPCIRDIFHTLRGGKLLTKIDPSGAYIQIELDDESKEMAVINTPFGLYQYQRLPFGISSEPGEFQNIMEQLFADLPVAVYLDDIVVSGKDDMEHLQTLKEVFGRLQSNRFRCNQLKCTFAKKELEYLGHTLSAAGIRPSENIWKPSKTYLSHQI